MFEDAKRKAAAILAAIGVTAGGVMFVKSMEGRVHQAYPDPGVGWALPTICDGHTRGVKRGDVATDAQCDAFLRADMNEAAKPLGNCIKKPLGRGEFDPVVSFNYNTGAACRSAPVAAINAGKSCDEIADAFFWKAPIQQVCMSRDVITGECTLRTPNVYRGSRVIAAPGGVVLMRPGDPIRHYTTGGGALLPGLVVRRWKEGERYRAACRAEDAEERAKS